MFDKNLKPVIILDKEYAKAVETGKLGSYKDTRKELMFTLGHELAEARLALFLALNYLGKGGRSVIKASATGPNPSNEILSEMGGYAHAVLVEGYEGGERQYKKDLKRLAKLVYGNSAKVK